MRNIGKESKYSTKYIEEELLQAKEILGSGDQIQAQVIWSRMFDISPAGALSSRVGLDLFFEFVPLGEIEAAMQDACKSDANNVYLAIGFVETALRQGTHEEALRRSKIVCKRFPGVAASYIAVAACLTALQHSKEAEEFVEHAVSKLPRSFELLVEHARYAESRRDWHSALQRWNRTQKWHDTPGVALGICNCLRELGRYDEAKDIATDIGVRFSGGHWASVELANIAGARGNFVEASQHWMAVRKYSPYFLEAYVVGLETARKAGLKDDVEDILSEGLARFPTNLALHLEHARDAERREDWSAALESWADIRDRFPQCDEALGQLAKLALLVKEHASSFVEKVEEPKSAPIQSDKSVAIAKLAWRNGDLETARAAWLSSLVKPAEWITEARALMEAGESGAAEDLLALGMKEEPDAVDIHFEHAMLAHRLDKSALAAFRFVEVSRRFPNHPEAWIFAMRELRNIGHLDEAGRIAGESVQALPNSVAVLLEAANVAESRRDTNLVHTLCRQVREVFPVGPDAYIIEVRTARVAGELDRAEQILAEAANAGASHPALLEEAAILSEIRKDFIKMAHFAAEFCHQYPSLPQGYEMMVRSHLGSGDIDTAESFVSHLPAEVVMNVGLVRMGCILSLRRNDHSEYLTRVEKAILQFPEIAEFHGMMAVALRLNGKYAEAEAYAEAQMARFPEELRLKIEFAIIADIKNDIVVAADRWATVCTNFPDVPDGCENLARVLLSLGRYAEAEVVASAGYERFPNNFAVARQWGWSATRRHDWPEAFRRWGVITDRFPDSPELREGLGETRLTYQLSLADKGKY